MLQVRATQLSALHGVGSRFVEILSDDPAGFLGVPNTQPQSEFWRPIPVLLITGGDDVEIGPEEGAASYLDSSDDVVIAPFCVPGVPLAHLLREQPEHAGEDQHPPIRDVQPRL